MRPTADDSARGTGDDILCDSEQAQPRTLTDGDHGAGGRWPRLPLGATARTTPPSCHPCGPRDAAKPTGTENRRHVNTREQRGGCGPRAATCGVTETDKPPAPSPRETMPGKHDSTEKREERLRTFFLPPGWE